MERPRPRGRLTRSERVASPLGAATSPLSANGSPLSATGSPSGPFSQSSAWQLFIRDSLLHIAWPISLSSDGEVSDRAVRISYRMWPLIVALISAFITRTTTNTPQPAYNDIPVPHNFDDPEPKIVPPFEMRSDDDWKQERPHQSFVVNNFAGRAEFPAIVHIRNFEKRPDLLEQKEGYWNSIGNLVLPQHVLTTCRAISNVWIEADARAALDKQVPLKPMDSTRMIVRFCSAYEFEVNKFRAKDGNMVVETGQSKSVGWRLVTKVYFDIDCGPQKFSSDLGILELDKTIDPTASWINYMLVPMNKDGKVLQLLPPEGNVMCFVGSFGGYYVNLKPDQNILVFRKTHFRAYKIDLAPCLTRLEYTCLNEGDKSTCKTYRPEDLTAYGIECYETRSKVGTVCDRDRGAPLVCDGLTQGMVIRAAPEGHCNNVYPLPFLVQRVYNILPFFTKLTENHQIPYNPMDDPRNCKVRKANCAGERTAFSAPVSSSPPVKAFIVTLLVPFLECCYKLLSLYY